MKTLNVLIKVFGMTIILWTILGSQGSAKELPILVTLEELEGDQYNTQRVVVMGSVRSVEGKRGRQGSQYFQIEIDDEERTITILSLSMPKISPGHFVAVQGTFHQRGWFAGYPMSQYIIAEMVVKTLR